MTSEGVCVHVSVCGGLPRPLHETPRRPLPPTGGDGGAPPRITLGEEGEQAPTPPLRSRRSGSRASVGTDSSLLGTPCMCFPPVTASFTASFTTSFILVSHLFSSVCLFNYLFPYSQSSFWTVPPSSPPPSCIFTCPQSPSSSPVFIIQYYHHNL